MSSRETDLRRLAAFTVYIKREFIGPHERSEELTRQGEFFQGVAVGLQAAATILSGGDITETRRFIELVARTVVQEKGERDGVEG